MRSSRCWIAFELLKKIWRPQEPEHNTRVLWHIKTRGWRLWEGADGHVGALIKPPCSLTYSFIITSSSFNDAPPCAPLESGVMTSYTPNKYRYFACELADWIIVHKHEPPFSFKMRSVFFPPKRLSLHSQWFSLSAWSDFFFRWCLCMCYKRTDLCPHAYAHVCRRSRPSNNKSCLQSTWVSSLGSHSTWTPFTPDACGPCVDIRREETTLCEQQKGRRTDITQVSYGRPLRIGKPGLNLGPHHWFLTCNKVC